MKNSKKPIQDIIGKFRQINKTNLILKTHAVDLFSLISPSSLSNSVKYCCYYAL